MWYSVVVIKPDVFDSKKEKEIHCKTLAEAKAIQKNENKNGYISAIITFGDVVCK